MAAIEKGPMGKQVRFQVNSSTNQSTYDWLNKEITRLKLVVVGKDEELKEVTTSKEWYKARAERKDQELQAALKELKELRRLKK